ncbi:MAG: ferredoxin-type protein NapF [Rhodospirillales bacterium]
MRASSHDPVDRTRRGLLTGEGAGLPDPIRPPWTDESRIADACTRCDMCIEACPERVLIHGQGGFPAFDPNAGTGACTFCGVCATTCPEDVFDTAKSRPWDLTIQIASDDCLAIAGVHCATCSDVCDDNAIRMPPRIGGPPHPEINADRCTGCGACVGACPADAVSLVHDTSREAA